MEARGFRWIGLEWVGPGQQFRESCTDGWRQMGCQVVVPGCGAGFDLGRRRPAGGRHSALGAQNKLETKHRLEKSEARSRIFNHGSVLRAESREIDSCVGI